MTVVGIDTHKDTLAACAADDVGRAVAHRSFENTPQGHAELAGWVHELEAALVAMEGSGNYGRPAAVALASAGVAVVEVPLNMTAAARRRQRTGTKTDPADALAIARVGLAEPALRPPRPGGHIEELRCLVRYRCELTAERTRQINRLHADLSQLRPGCHSARARIARSRITTLRSLRRDITSLAKEIHDAVEATGTTLRRIDGIGDFTAADILTHVGDPTRFGTKAAFAMANGTAPIEASSGRVRRHRLNRGGNRQINKAIHTAAIAQIARPDTEGRRYYERCIARGKTEREAIRALKRRISDRIWTHLNTTRLT